MSPCHPFRPVPGQCGPNRRGPLPAPPFDPRDYWATRKCVSKLFASLETKLDKVDVVDPGAATEAGKAADAKSTYEELSRILAKLAKKADKATTLAGYGITDAATKAEIAAKADLVGGKVPAAQLPSYVDDVLEYGTMSAFPATGESGKIYVAKDTNLVYRWSGTQYVEISPSPVLDDTVTEASSNGVKSSGIWSWVKSLIPHWLTSDYAEPATVESVAEKRDNGDLAVYTVTRTENTDWTWTGENAEIVEALNNAHSKPYRADISGQESWADIDPFPFDLSRYSTYGIEKADLSATSLWYKLRDMASFEEITVYATRPRYMDETLGPEKPNQQLAAVATGDAQTPANGDLVKYDAANDRFVKATAGTDYAKQDDIDYIINVYGTAISNLENNKADRATTLSGYGITDGATKTELAAAVSTNNPAFVSAVQNTPTSGMPEDMPTDWGIFGTVGAALAALAAGLKWCKNILGSLASGYSTFAAWIASKLDRASLMPEYSATSAYSVGAIVYYGGNIYQCTTAIADGGEAWNAEHWKLKKLNDFFTESNSLLNGRLAYSRNATGLKDRAFNALTFDGTEYNLSTALAAVAPTASGQPRDLLIVATATAATTISFTAGTIKGDKPTIDGVGTWLITLTEYAADTWYCRQIKMEDAA